MAMLQGFIVATTDAAVAYVDSKDAKESGINPLWIPRKKIAELIESDNRSIEIQTGKLGVRIGIPHNLNVDDSFLAKITGA